MSIARKSSERDPLRGRFTRFMEVMVKHARQNYDEMQRRLPSTVPLDAVPETYWAQDGPMPQPCQRQEFQFEEDRLAIAFAQLPIMRQKVLMLLFVAELTPEEIAHELGCSVGHVYNQRSLALKKLREILKEGGFEG